MLLLFVFDLKSLVDIVFCKCLVVALLFHLALLSKKHCISRINLFHTVTLAMREDRFFVANDLAKFLFILQTVLFSPEQQACIYKYALCDDLFLSCHSLLLNSP